MYSGTNIAHCAETYTGTDTYFKPDLDMNRCRVFLAVLVLTVAATLATASPTDREVVLCQPDGYTFSAHLRGDEFAHILKTMDGCVIVKDDDGYYCYAVPGSDGSRCSSGYRIGDSNVPAEVLSVSRQAGYSRISGQEARLKQSMAADAEPLLKRVMRAGAMTKTDGPALKHGIVILAQFNDVTFRYTREDFVEMLTAEGYSRDGATGSAIDYFNAQFNGRVEFSFDVSEIVTLPKARSYYGKNYNNIDGNDFKPAEMIAAACTLADAEIDFSRYDDDGDGEVDNVFVFYAGADEAQVGDPDLIWSHAWYIKDGADINLTLDGKVINRYACSSELSGTSDMASIGTFCHEYSHTFGLPDFYDTDYEGEDGLISAALWNSTSLMDAGNYNNNGHTPPYFNAVEREYLGISEPEMLAEGEYVLEPISENGRYLRMDTETEGEYFLIECRSGKEWDAYINNGTGPASGLLIYHVDKSSSHLIYSSVYGKETTPEERWGAHNEVNANPEHQCADLIEADGRTDRVTSTGGRDLTGIFFPAGSTSFTPDGTPAFKDWDDNLSPLSIVDISMDGDNVRFSVVQTSGVTPAANNISVDAFQDAAIISWKSNISTTRTAWLTGSWDSKEIEVVPYSAGKYSCTIEGLSPGKEYALSIRFRSDTGEYGEKVSEEFTTRRLPASNAFPYISFPVSGKAGNGSFVKGTLIPLRVINATAAESIVWSFNGQTITAASDGTDDGYYSLDEDGELKAEVIYPDGIEIIKRSITIR